LILSVAKYYSPGGKAIQETAVTPNILVADETDNAISDDEEPEPSTPEPEAKPKSTQDDQLHKAIEVLKSRAS
jgi:carboxyl-terminal processing protease